MQNETVVKLITRIKANYRYTYRDVTKEEMKLMVKDWHDCLSSYSEEEVEGAFRVALCKCKMPPTIADLMEILTRQAKLKEPIDAEYWTELTIALDAVKKPVCCEGDWREFPLYVLHKDDAEKIYSTLSAPVKRIVDYSTFLDYARESDEELRFERARFLKALPEIRETLREQIIATRSEKMLSGGERLFLPEEK